MITAFCALLVVALIWAAGFLAAMSGYERSRFLSWLSLVVLAFGAFGIYTLIVGE